MARKLLLPQNDPQGKQQRQQYLKKMRQIYEYQFNFCGNIAQLKKLSLREWNEPIFFLIILVKLILFVPIAIWAYLKTLIKGYPFKNYRDYFFFPCFPYPNEEFLDDFNDDVHFALQRVAGINPVAIQGLSIEANPLPENFKEAKSVVNKLTNQTYEEALKDGRLYITNYQILKEMTENLKKVDGITTQYTTDPIALYYRQDNGLLQPLAIQLYVTKPTSETNPIYTPADGKYWLMAKNYVQTADGVLAIMLVHTTHTHYTIESIIIASYRNLPPRHPLFPLIYPQFRGTLGLDHIVNYFRPYGHNQIPPVASIMPGNEEMLLKFIGEGMRTYNFKDKSFINDINKRLVEDPNLFYPYRDDGKLLWDAIHEFVREYVNIYYKSDQDVVEDFELQAWADEIGGSLEEKKCQFPGFPTKLNTIDQVIEIIGNIIFIASAHHSAIHYTMYQHLAYVPNMPLSLYAPPSINSEGLDLMKLLATFYNTIIQSFGFYINNIKVIRIGKYNLSMFDGRSNEIIKKYQEKLQEISNEVNARNQERIFPYIFLDPKNIANSIIV